MVEFPEIAYFMSKDLLSKNSKEDVYEKIAITASKFIKSDLITIFAVNYELTKPGGPELLDKIDCVKYYKKNQFIKEDFTLSMGESIIGSVIENGEPIVIKDFKENLTDAYYEVEKQFSGMTSLLSIPIFAGPLVLGALNIYSENIYEFSEQDEEIGNFIALLGGIFIYNSTLFENANFLYLNQKQQNEKIGTLLSVSNLVSSSLDLSNILSLSADKLIEFTGVNAAAVYFVDKEENKFCYEFFNCGKPECELYNSTLQCYTSPNFQCAYINEISNFCKCEKSDVILSKCTECPYFRSLRLKLLKLYIREQGKTREAESIIDSRNSSRNDFKEVTSYAFGKTENAGGKPVPPQFITLPSSFIAGEELCLNCLKIFKPSIRNLNENILKRAGIVSSSGIDNYNNNYNKNDAADSSKNNGSENINKKESRKEKNDKSFKDLFELCEVIIPLKTEKNFIGFIFLLNENSLKNENLQKEDNQDNQNEHKKKYANNKSNNTAGLIDSLDFLTAVSDIIAVALSNAESLNAVEEAHFETINSMSEAIEARDEYTKNHGDRLVEYATLIAAKLSLSEAAIRDIKYGAVLHDVGKIGIRDSVLNKPGKLTDEEYEEIKKHPEIGFNLLKKIKFLAPVANIVLHHQERYDGKGYPEGLQGNSIPVGSRIIAVIDTFDAMTTNRPYRKAMPKEKALQEIKKCSGTQFDPNIVDIFFKIVSEEETASDKQ
jgi:HD-GYP domain-containing protein (c-di-GMP phosphodiesterase class II)